MLKKILKIAGITLLVLIVAALIVPILFKGKIVRIAKQEINKSINAKTDFKDIDISFFRHFPRVAVGLEDLSVVGIDNFSNDTLIAAKRIDVAVNIMSIISGKEMDIYSIMVDNPRIRALVDKTGKANWDIIKPSEEQIDTAQDATSFKMKLNKYSVNNGYLYYNDATSNMTAEIVNLDHEGSGDFTSDLFTLAIKTKADQVNFNYEGIPYLNKTKTVINGDVEVSVKDAMKLNFNINDIALNDLKLSTEGFFELTNDSTYNMDIKFNAPSTEFKTILSLVPAIYKNDFNKIKTSGSSIFNGFVKGIYSGNKMPAYSLNLQVKDGYFQYPDLPQPVKNINVAMKVDNPDGITDNTVVNISRAHLEMGSAPFDFSLLLKKPVSDCYIDLVAKGKLDLSQVAQFVKLETGTKLSGLLEADVQAKGNVSAAQKKQFDKFDAKGFINVANLQYASKDYPDGITLKTSQLTFNPKNVSLSNTVGSFMQTNFVVSGILDNAPGYVFKNEDLSGSLNLTSDKVNLNKLMGTPATTEENKTAASQPFAVPKNISFAINAKVDEVVYDKVNYTNVNGMLVIADETVSMKNLSLNALDGSITVNGTYSTKENKRQPDIHLAYDIKNIDVQKAFLAYNTMQKLMPIGRFISGKLSSSLTVNGKMGEGMMPDISTLTGNGNLFLSEGELKNTFVPLTKLAQALNIQQLQELSLKDVKSAVEFANGKVLVKPFTVKVKDIVMEIGGTHGLDKSMDYIINMSVPRAMLGSSANQLVDNLAAKAAQKGVPVNIGETINFNVRLGGTMENPSIKTDLKSNATNLADQMKQQATDFAKAKIDSTKTAVTNAAKDSLKSVKATIIKSAEYELKKKLFGGKDSATQQGGGTQDAKKKVEESAKGLINNLFKKKKDTVK